MNTNEINEGNKLIAEFMGWEVCEYTNKITNPKHPMYRKNTITKELCIPHDHPIVEGIYTDVPGYHWDYEKEDDNGNAIARLIFFEGNLKFHTSWDWLMPVALKCRESQVFGANNLIVSICNGLYIIDIEIVWKACVDFIKYYNHYNYKLNNQHHE